MIVVAEVTKKWSNLRSQYLKELNLQKQKKSGSGGSEIVVRWRFFPLLQFLGNASANTTARRSNLSVSHNS